jgi:hypothetical protein
MSDDEPTDHSEQQADEQTADGDQPAEQAEEQPTDSDQPAEQSEEQPADSDQSETSASADNTVAFAGDAASPGGGGPGVQARPGPKPKRPPALVKRRFAFVWHPISDGVPDALQDKIPTLEGGELDFLIKEEISPGKTQRVGDSVTAAIDLEASLSGVVHFASTIGTNFSIEYIVSPPAGVGGTPLPRGNKVNPSDWKVTKMDAASRKLNPGGAFVVSITVPVVFVLEQVQAGSTLDANLASRDIDRTDITFQSPPKSGTDPAGNPVQEFEILIWGKPFFTATATKYLP